MSKVVYFLYLLARTLSKFHIPFLPKLIQILIRFLFGCHIPYTAQIGKNTEIAYGGIGIVIHSRCIIGENCVIEPGVVLGGTSKKWEVPKIGDNVYIGTGARIVGPVVVGDNVMIGANAVVNKDVPGNTLVGGVPAKIIKQNINIEDYL